VHSRKGDADDTYIRNNAMKNMFAILLRLIGIGSVAGLIATIPMTLFMLLMQQVLPKWQKYALPLNWRNEAK
jgi:hypothetical protein